MHVKQIRSGEQKLLFSKNVALVSQSVPRPEWGSLLHTTCIKGKPSSLDQVSETALHFRITSLSLAFPIKAGGLSPVCLRPARGKYTASQDHSEFVLTTSSQNA
jgi:hypothetical protein